MCSTAEAMDRRALETLEVDKNYCNNRNLQEKVGVAVNAVLPGQRTIPKDIQISSPTLTSLTSSSRRFRARTRLVARALGLRGCTACDVVLGLSCLRSRENPSCCLRL